MRKKKFSVFLSILLIIVLSTQGAFALPSGEFKALGNTESGILYGYSEPQDVKIVLTNSLEEDVKITKIESTNTTDFDADLESDIVISSDSRENYPVFLKTGKPAGTYEAKFTFTDEESNTYNATVKAIVVEEVNLSVQNPADTQWDYEEALTAKISIQNGTKEKVTLVKAESSNDVFKIKDISTENIEVGSLKSSTYDVVLPIGQDVGIYKTTITFTDSNSNTYEQEVSVKVTKKELTVPAIVGEYVYNGERQEVVFDANYIEKYIGLAEDYGSAIKAGHYAPVVFLKDKANTTWVIEDAYSTVNQTLSWDIEKYQLTKPEAKDVEYVYNTDMQTFKMNNVTSKLFGKDVLTITGGEKTNAGESEVIVSINDKENFVWEDGTDTNITFTWTMERAKVKEPVAVKTNYDYNGSAQAIEFEKDSVDETLMEVRNNSRTAIGNQEVTVALKDKVNYKWATSGEDTDLTFTLAIGTPVYGVPSITGSYTYNGKVQQPILSGFDAEHMNVTNNSGKNAGTYSVVISLKDKANAVWADTNTSEDKVLSWNIEKAPVTVKANNLVAKIGDITPVLNADGYKISGIIVPDSLGFIPAIAYETEPNMLAEGVTNILVSGATESTDGNYAVTYENGTLTVSENPQQAQTITSVILNFDLPLAGSKDMAAAIDNIKLNTSFVQISFENGSGNAIGIFDKATDADITQEVAANGLTEGANVYFKLKIAPADQKVIDPNVTQISVNGVTLTKEEVALVENGDAIKVHFTVPAYRIHFTKGAGTGSMSTEYAYSTSEYVMPGSSFTAPSGMQFSAWKLEGGDTLYTAGEKVQLTASINLIAQYREKETATTPGTGSGSIGPVIGGGSSTVIRTVKETTKTTIVQKPVFVVPTGVKYNVSKDGTAATFTAANGKYIKAIYVNDASKGSVRSITGLKTGDTVKVVLK